MLRLVDAEILGYSLRKTGIGELPTGLRFAQIDRIGAVSIDLVGRHVNEGTLGTETSSGFEKIECADGIRVEIVEWNFRGPIVRWLRGAVNDGVRAQGAHEVKNSPAIPDVEFVMPETFDDLGQANLVPPRAASLAKKDFALIVVESVDAESEAAKTCAHFGSDQA
jgi:hypothetical protein